MSDFKIGEELFIYNDSGDYEEVILKNINNFREPSMKYVVELISNGSWLFAGDETLARNVLSTIDRNGIKRLIVSNKKIKIVYFDNKEKSLIVEEE